MGTKYLAGYDRTLTGGGFPYHAPQPDAATSLLIRSESEAARIAWLTEPVPPTERGEFVRFLMLAAIDVNAEDPRQWTMRIGDRDAFTIITPREPIACEQRWDGPEGASLALSRVEVDRYDDLMGCLILTIPRRWTKAGEAVRIEVRGEGAASRTWFMVYEYAARDRVTVVPVQAVRRDPAGPRQVLRVEVVRYHEPERAEVTVGPHRFALDLGFGYNVGYLDVPEIAEPVTLPVSVVVGPNTEHPGAIHLGEVTLPPVARRTVHLLAHSHVDVGYTHRQDEVERIQWAHLEKALDLARRTRDCPPGARFRWNTEVMWALDSYLRAAPPPAREALKAGIRDGWIELDALFANELTALCSPAELLELTEAARRVASDCGVTPLAAMITDIPGFTWSLVTALARSGVRYFSVGPNRGHRVGRMTDRLGDRPFWWVSPSGDERVLCWVHGEGYSLFHTRMYAERIENRLDEATVLPCLERLVAAAYPHETVVLRYTVGSDNGPPHDAMPDVVRDWNERYLTPRLVISTVTEAFRALEAEAGDRLPVLRGDLTAYWEDGAASTALETAMNRANAERLAQAEAVYALVQREAYPDEEFREGWREVMLFDEHTWGSWNSVSEPDAELTRGQWAAKRSYALAADATSRRLLSRALSPRVAPAASASAIEVINTECWPRTDLVRAPLRLMPSVAGARVLEDSGEEVPSQILTTGELVFVARDVPPLGSRIYRVAASEGAGAHVRPLLRPGSARAGDGPFRMSADSIESDEFAVRVNRADGSLRSVLWKRGGLELADQTAAAGLNGYLYVAGRDPVSAVPARDVAIAPGERGPVVASLRITSEADGCERLTREVVLVAGLDRVEMVDTLDKEAVRAPEAVHFAFPLNVPGGVVRYDLAFGSCRVETDQLPGGNRNYLTVAYAADVSNDEMGITLACPHAPLIEVGALRADPTVVGWLERLDSSPLLFGYAMNNYWETNYRAEQPGRVSLRYLLAPHGRLSLPATRRFGAASRRPLLAAPVREGQTPLTGPPCPTAPGVEIVALRPLCGALLMVLHNADSEPATVGWLRPPGRIRLCDLDGRSPEELAGELVLPSFGVRSVLVD